MSIHEYVLSELQATKHKWPEVAEKSGVPYGTLKKITQRGKKHGVLHPRIDTLEKLAKYFGSHGGPEKGS